MRRTLWLATMIAATIAVFSIDELAAADPQFAGRGAAGASPRPIANRVLDLLDEEIAMTQAEGQAWESAPFDTAQYNRIGLHIEGEAEPGSGILCTAAWQFTPADEFDPAGPSVGLGVFRTRQFYPTNPGNGNGGLGDDPSMPDLDPSGPYVLTLLPLSSPFGPVYGLRAKVVCTPGSIGQDPPEAEPGAAGKLRDLKVLLRRE